MLFDTLFHQTLSPEVYTYPLPSPDTKLPIPLRKYGFHGLSYASIVNTLSRTWDKPRDKINLVVAHLGSGASACCIRGGESIDTSMGLTPLEGLVGGTRTGTIDPTAIFHQTSDFAADAGLKDISVTKAEYVMNKKSGLTALAGTQNYAIITARAADKSLSNCTAEEHESAKLAHAVFVDRLLSHISSYLCKLLSSVPLEEITLVFSGGIGENSAPLRADVLKHFGWLGAKVDEKKNDVKHGQVRVISADNSKLNAVVVETDEEGWCAHMAREEFGF